VEVEEPEGEIIVLLVEVVVVGLESMYDSIHQPWQDRY
jgi:hypothetical protein